MVWAVLALLRYGFFFGRTANVDGPKKMYGAVCAMSGVDEVKKNSSEINSFPRWIKKKRILTKFDSHPKGGCDLAAAAISRNNNNNNKKNYHDF